MVGLGVGALVIGAEVGFARIDGVGVEVVVGFIVVGPAVVGANDGDPGVTVGPGVV